MIGKLDGKVAVITGAGRGIGRADALLFAKESAAVGGLHYQVGYACSKAGMSGLAKTVAIEHSKDGITCNVIVLGLIGTPLVLAMPEEIRREFATTRTPAGKIGDVEDVANAVVFLASEQAKYITGAELCVDGGAHLGAFPFAIRHLSFSRDAGLRGGGDLTGTLGRQSCSLQRLATSLPTTTHLLAEFLERHKNDGFTN